MVARISSVSPESQQVTSLRTAVARKSVQSDPTDHAPGYDPYMADDFYRPNRAPDPPRQPQGGERLFEFYREADHARFMCELPNRSVPVAAARVEPKWLRRR